MPRRERDNAAINSAADGDVARPEPPGANQSAEFQAAQTAEPGAGIAPGAVFPDGRGMLDAMIHSLDLLYADLPDAVLIADQERRIVWLNDAVEGMFGYTRGELIGQKTAVLYADQADFAETGRERYNARPTAARSHYQVRYRRCSGEIFESETTGGPLKTPDGSVAGFIGIIRDVSAERAFDDALSQLYRLAWEQSLSTDEKMTALLKLGCNYLGTANGAMVRLEGTKAVIRHVRDRRDRLQPGDALPLDDSLAGMVIRGDRPVLCSSETRDCGAVDARPACQTLALTEGPVTAWIGAPLIVEQQLYGCVYFWTAAPRRPFARAERELATFMSSWVGHKLSRQDAMDRLETARATAEKASRAKSYFLAALSHDLRTPFTALIGMLELMRVEEDGAERKTLLGHAHRAATTLSTLIDDMLDLVQADDGGMELSSHPIALQALVEEVMAPFAPIAAARGVLMESRIAPGLPSKILSDRPRLRQALHKLVSNATKYTTEGSVLLEIGPAERPGFMAITLTDTGIGIAADDQARIFEPFEQVGADSARRETGLGLGLPLCRRIVEAMGGHVALVSTPGEGSRFRIEMPCRPAKSERQPAPPGAPNKTSTRPRRILLAEDNATSALLLKRMLGRMGHDVTHVGDGVEAVDAAAAEHFDVGVFDMRMPNLDGLSAMHRIHAASPSDRLPVIALTADGRAERRSRYDDPGLSAFLTKPVDWDALEAAIQTHARGTQHARRA
ncbi:MAG: ATP-binding protein [Pseudomonadota bacterium]